MSKSTRVRACELAATVMASHESGEPYAPKIWSLCVFFEQYIEFGADGTMKDFGPKKRRKAPVIKLVPSK